MGREFRTVTMKSPLLSRLLLSVLLLAVTITSSTSVEGSNPQLGILGRSAPELEVDAWFNLPEEIEQVSLADLKGKVVYLFFFQSWCPGCHSHGFPAMVEAYEHFEEETDVVFIAVQTTFEGYGSNTADRAEESVASYGLPIPVGHDSDEEGKGVSLMRKYRSGGTPWTVLIDRDGVVRFNGFQISGPDAIGAVQALLDPSS